MADIKTRFLILSDTHGMELDSSNMLDLEVDVVIHCGDLTDRSKIEEYHTAVTLLKGLKAPLKLCIAGNHDFSMDKSALRKKVLEVDLSCEEDLVAKFFGTEGEVKTLFQKENGMVFLDKGSHEFRLQNGALLTVYADPFTPSLDGGWGFQYHPDETQNFDILKGTDVVITHGPPRGIMDYTHDKERAGCPQLFTAIAKARPRLHCFGHIHEGWGAKLAAWRPADLVGDNTVNKKGKPHTTPLSHLTAIDNESSVTIDKLANLKPSKFESTEDVSERVDRVDELCRRGYRATSHCTDDKRPLRYGNDTLFVNASIQGEDGALSQHPWVIDLELPPAGLDVTQDCRKRKFVD